MDVGTVIGIVAGLFFILVAIIMGGGSGFLDGPSMMITIGGSFAATLMNFPLPKIVSTMKVVRKAFTGKGPDVLAIYKTVSDFAVRARRDGILALEEDIEKVNDEFMKKGFQMAVDGSTADVISHVMREDINSMGERHLTGIGIFKALANYAPAFGMIGTLIGLVQMLRNLSDPSSIGSGMATALITTFYGALVSNLIALPIAGKLEQRSNEEIAVKNMILEGILAVQEGNSPRVVQEKLRSFIAPDLRAKTEGE